MSDEDLQSDDDFEFVEFPIESTNYELNQKFSKNHFSLKKYTDQEEEDDIFISEGIEQLTNVQIDEDMFNDLFDYLGVLKDFNQLKKLVFNFGCNQNIRIKVWKFLFKFYSSDSSSESRKQTDIKRHYRYHALKRRCEMFLSQSTGKSSSSLETQPLPLYKGENTATDSEMLHHDTDARIYAFSRKSDLEGVTDWYKILEKDMPRVCCDHPVFKKDTVNVLKKMKNILQVYAFFHCEVGYVQGMTDLLSNFMAVFDNEVEAYWCFNNYMENVQHWYTVEGIKERPHLVKSLLRDLEPNLHSHLINLEGFLMCHNWLFVAFKRDFDVEESVTYFEISQSETFNHQRDFCKVLKSLKKLHQNDGCTKEEEPLELLGEVNSEYSYEIFTCVALFMLKRQDLFACSDCTDVLAVAQCACRQLGLERVHRKTYNLYHKYLYLKAKKHLEIENSTTVFHKMSKVLKSKLKIKS